MYKTMYKILLQIILVIVLNVGSNFEVFKIFTFGVIITIHMYSPKFKTALLQHDLPYTSFS